MVLAIIVRVEALAATVTGSVRAIIFYNPVVYSDPPPCVPSDVENRKG